MSVIYSTVQELPFDEMHVSFSVLYWIVYSFGAYLHLYCIVQQVYDVLSKQQI